MSGINERNFCHIEEMPDGRRVVFYIEHECDDMILHQVTLCDMGTIDLKLTMPADKWEAHWPPNFTSAASRLLLDMEKVGLVPAAPSKAESEG
nr:hypothetical protein RAR13_11725 [Aminobacter aminovorans]